MAKRCCLDYFLNKYYTIRIVPIANDESCPNAKISMKVFISNIDSPLGHNLSRILSRTVPGSRLEKGDEERQETTEENPVAVMDVVKETYKVSGSFVNALPLNLQTSVLQVPAIRGRMIETGDRIKDAGRREAIEKIPIRKEKATWVTEAVCSVN